MKNYRAALELFIISFLFMLLFQIESRLISYIYFFHEGLVLVESMLLGGGLFLLLSKNRKIKQLLSPDIDSFILMAFILQLLFLFNWHYFVTDVIFLSILFGLIFFKITNYLWLSPNKFYFLDLIGSVVAIMIYILLVMNYLEEVFLPIILIGMMFLCLRNQTFYLKAFNLLMISIYLFLALNLHLVQMIHHDPIDDSYKSFTYDDRYDILPDSSFSDLKGRTDLFLLKFFYRGEDGESKIGDVVTLRSTGYFVSESYRDIENMRIINDPRISFMDYKPGSKILILGSSIGSNIQAYLKYVKDPKITAVDLDRTVSKIYESNEYGAFLPDRSKYELIISEGRRFAELESGTYDIIFVAAESINSMDEIFVDERTSNLVTKEAIERYLEILNPDGYLIIVQYHPNNRYGDEMLYKLLNTLEEAVTKDISEKILIHSYSFGTQNDSMRLAVVNYKNGALTDADYDRFFDWYRNINMIDELKNNITYYNESERRFSGFYDVTQRGDFMITDDKPFRHKITTLPFPNKYYIYFAIFGLIFLGILFYQKSDFGNLVLSALIGLIVFGMQYLLFYKVASFFHTSLTFFSVYLIIPLFFGSIGGLLSKKIRRRSVLILGIFFMMACLYLANADIFRQNLYLILFLVGLIFFFLGLFFPRLLMRSKGQRTQVYSTNVFVGGLAFLLVVTLHATIGWMITFYMIMVLTVIVLLTLLFT